MVGNVKKTTTGVLQIIDGGECKTQVLYTLLMVGNVKKQVFYELLMVGNVKKNRCSMSY